MKNKEKRFKKILIKTQMECQIAQKSTKELLKERNKEWVNLEIAISVLILAV